MGLLSEIPRGCTYEVLTSSVMEAETREEVVIEIAEVLESIGFPNITAVFNTPLGGILAGSGEMSSGDETNDEPLKTLYRAIAKEFEIETAEEVYDNFAEAVNQITEAKIAACEDGASVSEDDIPRLASKYRALKEDVMANIVEMRDIFGTMLCLSKRDHEERKRSSTPGEYCLSRKSVNCSCRAYENITCVCQFFDCHDSNDAILPILGIFVDEINLPCLAFVVDTTSSMTKEIELAQQVMKNFLASEEDDPYCYVLQPFNDFGDDDPRSKNSYIMFAIVIQVY